MSMTRDIGHQALDINVGRILEMFVGSQISLAIAKRDLAQLFDQPKNTIGAADLDDYLELMLGQVKSRDIETGEARADLVRIAALAQAHDADFTAHIQRGED